MLKIFTNLKMIPFKEHKQSISQTANPYYFEFCVGEDNPATQEELELLGMLKDMLSYKKYQIKKINWDPRNPYVSIYVKDEQDYGRLKVDVTSFVYQTNSELTNEY